MTVAFRSSANVTNGTAGTTTTVSKPAGTADGDVLVAFIGRNGTTQPTAPAGWTLIGHQSASGTVALTAYYKVASGEPASWTWTGSGSVVNWGVVNSYTGVDTTNPVSASHSDSYTAAGTAFTTTVSPLENFGYAVSACAAVRTASGTATTWTPSGTERADLSTNGGTGTDIAGEVQDSALTNPSPTQSYGPTLTASQSQSAAVVWGLILSPNYGTFRPADVLPATLEAAFGVDLTTDPNTWTWTDISSRMKGMARIERGRLDEAQQTQPSDFQIRLDNEDGWLTPRHPSSQWYLQWGRGTPLRFRISTPTVGPFTRFQGKATSIQPVWPSGNSEVAFVDVVAKGLLYHLDLGDTPADSALKHAILAEPHLVAYWPLEDASRATQLAPAAGTTPMLFSGDTPTLSSGGPDGSAPLLTMGSLTRLSTPVSISLPSVLSGTGYTIEFYIKIPSAPGGTTPILEWHSTGTIVQWRFTLFPATGNFGLEGWNGSSRVIDAETTITAAPLYGTDWFISIAVRQNAGNIEYEWEANSPTGGNGFTGGSVAGTRDGVADINTPLGNGIWPRSSWVYGHIAVYSTPLDSPWGSLGFSHFNYMNGFAGESPLSRVEGTASVAGIPETSRGLSQNKAMGPQPVATPLTVMREAEAVDLGLLTDGLDAGLRYLPGPDRYNIPATMALDSYQSQIKLPFEPVEDDQRVHHKVTASRSQGSSATFADSMAATEGEYPTSVTLNLADDSTLIHQAGFRAHLSAAPEMRAPVLSINLRDRPELIRPWLHMDIGSRYTASDRLAQHPPGGLDLVLEHYVEEIDSVTWKAQLTGSPFRPWRVFTIGDPTLGRLGTATATLTSNINTTAASISVTDPNPWTTTATFPGDFPLDVDIEGEQVRVTAITGSAPTWTFTVTRSVNGVVKAHNANAPVTLWRQPVLGL